MNSDVLGEFLGQIPEGFWLGIREEWESFDEKGRAKRILRHSSFNIVHICMVNIYQMNLDEKKREFER
jgi:hypothetical protein